MFWMDTRWMYVGFLCIYRVNRCQQFMFCRCQVPPFTHWGRQIKWTQIMTRIWAKSQGPRRSDPLLWMVIAHWNPLITSWFTHHLTCLLAVSWNNGPLFITGLPMKMTNHQSGQAQVGNVYISDDKGWGLLGGHGEGKYPKSWLAWTRMFFRQVETACQNLVGSTAGPTTDPELLISWSRFWPSNQRGILDSDSDSWFLTRIAGIVNHDRLLL